MQIHGGYLIPSLFLISTSLFIFQFIYSFSCVLFSYINCTHTINRTHFVIPLT
jgi:hypothetical protein